MRKEDIMSKRTVAKQNSNNSDAGSEATVVVQELSVGEIDFCVVGTTPMIHNRVSQKAWRELLLPMGKKTAVEKAMTEKHNPVQEYRDSPYRHQNDEHPTRIFFPGGGFKRALVRAAVDVPNVTGAQVGRLVWVLDDDIDVFGIPELFMAVVRNADQKRTPDIRSRAIMPEWACRVRVRFVRSYLKERHLYNLMASAGLINGVGDYRQEKGYGSYGQFHLVAEDDPDYLRLCKHAGRAAQDEALKNPAAYDAETEEMLSWYSAEIVKFRAKSVSKADNAQKKEVA